MFPHEQPYLFRTTAMRLEYCVDELENTEWGDLQWNEPEEERASHEIRKWCERYIAACDYHRSDKPADE